MRYAQIRKMDITNGEGIGVSLFTQGCPFHCEGCFNPETWDFQGGKEWTPETQQYFLSLITPSYIKRVSFLGGEPLAEPNLDAILQLVQDIKKKRPDIKVWFYSGNIYEHMTGKQKNILSYCDVLVDGPFVYKLRDITLPFRGSSNQRIIDIQKSLKQNKTILWEC